MEALVYGAEKVSSTKHTQFGICLNRARQAATTWSDADRQKPIERLQHKIHQVTLAKRKLFDESFQHHQRQQLQEVGTKATSPRCIFAKQLAVMKTAAENKPSRVPNMTADKRLQFQNCLSYVQIEATTSSLADPERDTIQLYREIYSISSNEQKRFKKEIFLCLMEFEPW